MFHKKIDVSYGMVKKPTSMRRMFKAKETLRSSGDGKYLIDLKNDRGEGKTTRTIVENNKERRRTQNRLG
jgi:hypothetical protein